MASQIVGFTNEAARQTNVASGRISSSEAAKLPIESSAPVTQKNTTVAPKTTTNIPPATSTGTATSGTANAIMQGNPNDPSIVNTLNANGQASDINARTALAKQLGVAYSPTASGQASADQNTALLSKYRSTFNTLKLGGTQAPINPGEANSAIQGATPPPETPPNQNEDPLSQLYLNDPAVQQSIQNLKDFQSQQKQQVSLVDEYKKMTQDSGLSEINAELINAKNIIDGTPDDIRNEITKAGGFATDSQVLAMADARDKVLIQNYNNLLQTKQNITDNINTMIGLSEKDRANSLTNMNMMMQLDSQISQFKDKAIQNAQDKYKTIASAIGFSGLLQSAGGDPYTTSLMEETLGLGVGGLQNLANAETSYQTQQAKLKSTEAYNNAYNAKAGELAAGAQYGGNVSEIDQAVAKQNATQNAADTQTIISNYQQIESLFPGKDLNSLTKSDVSKLSQSDQITIGKALARIQNYDLARAGGDPGNAMSPVGIPQFIGEQFRQAFSGRLYSNEKVLNAIKTANSLYSQRINPTETNQTTQLKTGEGGTLSSGITYTIEK